jgi:hypothetical protein
VVWDYDLQVSENRAAEIFVIENGQTAEINDTDLKNDNFVWTIIVNDRANFCIVGLRKCRKLQEPDHDRYRVSAKLWVHT